METQKPPASFTRVRLSQRREQRTDYAIHFPWLLGLIATRRTTGGGHRHQGPEGGASGAHRKRHRSPTAQLQKLRDGDKSAETRALFDKHKDDLGFGLLLKKYTANVVDATPEQKRMAADDTIPQGGAAVLELPASWWPRRSGSCSSLQRRSIFLAIRNLAPQRWLMRLAVL